MLHIFDLIKDVRLMNYKYQIFWMDLIDEGLSFLTNDQKILGDIEANNAFFNNLDVSDKN